MLIYAVLALLVLIFVALAALVLTSPARRGVRAEWGKLTSERIRSLALSLSDTTAVGRAPSLRYERFCAERAYRRIVSADSMGTALEKCERDFAADCHRLVAKTSRGGYRSLASLPHVGGEARVLVLARAITESEGGLGDAERVRDILTEFMRYTPLTFAEIAALPLAFEAAAATALGDVARSLIKLDSARSAAARDVQPDRRRSRRDGYVYFFISGGKHVDSRYLAPDARVDEASVRLSFLALTSRLCGRLAACASALDDLRSVFSDEFLASICPCREILERDDAFVRTDVRSRLAYFARIAKLAKAYSASERAVAGAAVALARESGAHFGSYLFDDPRYVKAKLRGGAPPRGKRSDVVIAFYIASTVLLDAALSVVAAVFAPSFAVGAAIALCCCSAFFPLATYAVDTVAATVASARPSPKLCDKSVPEDAATAVVMPVLVTSKEEAKDVCDRLSAIAAVNVRENVSYCLLCDFAAADSAECESDRELVDALKKYARQDVEIFVRRRKKERGKWRAEGRKRGAIAAFNAFLLGEGNDFCVFSQLHANFVIVIDEDNTLAPGAVLAAINSIRHPLAEKYDMLAFGAYSDSGRAETMYALSRSGAPVGYARRSDLIYDLCGRAVFCGKGIYRVGAFARKTASLPRRLLSHDIAEGAVTVTGGADVLVSELAPECPSADFARSERWKRGDLLLLPLIARKDVSAVYRRLILANAFGITSPIAAFALVAAFFASGSVYIAVAAAIACFAVPIARALATTLKSDSRASVVAASGARTLVGAVRDFALLPVYAAQNALLLLRCAAYAAIDSPKLTEWRTFASSGRESAAKFARWVLPGIALITVFAAAFWHNFAFSMWAVACVAASAAIFSQAYAPVRKPRALSAKGRAFAEQVAERAYAYFAAVGADRLACDNLQAYPPNGESATVSPTDLGFWMLADVCAAKLGILSAPDAAKSLVRKLTLCAKLPTVRGHLYNWYRRDGSVTAPRYISFVDSGNFAACLKVVRAYCREIGCCNGENLADGMDSRIDYSFFFDPQRGLFARGYDVDGGVFDGHYDLLASEARLAVYLGCASLGDDGAWKALGRARLGGVLPTLASWSGSAFEYLMPELFFDLSPHSELYRSAKRAVLKMRLRRCRGFWGISESGYHAFDADGNYQYRAHGIDLLALSSDEKRCVIAPYASALAVLFAPEAALRDLSRLRETGVFGTYGFYEAIDFSCGENIVYSYMTHHQGMLLAAMTELLAPSSLRSLFLRDDAVRGAKCLIDEPPQTERAVARAKQPFRGCKSAARYSVAAEPSEDATVCLASGGEYSCVIDECGCGNSHFGNASIGVFRGDVCADDGAFGLFLSADGAISPTFAPLRRDSGARAFFSESGARFESGDCALTVTVPTGTRGELRRYAVRNDSDSVREYTFVYHERLALMPLADYFAHPSFNDMFVETSWSRDSRTIFAERVSRERTGGMFAALTVLGDFEIVPDCDNAHFCALADGKYSAPDAAVVGRTMSPCFGFSCKVSVAPRQTAEIALFRSFSQTREGIENGVAAICRSDFSDFVRTAADGGVIGKYFEGERGAKLAFKLAAKIAYAPMPAAAVASRMCSNERAAATEQRKKTVVIKYGEVADFSMWTKACVACAVARLDFLLIVLYREEDIYGATVRRKLIAESGVSDLDRLAFVRLVDVRNDDALAAKLVRDAFCVAGDLSTPPSSGGIAVIGNVRMGRRDARVDLECGCGGFDCDGNYVVARRPPKPYSNVISLRKGGIVVTENGGGFRWFGNSYFRKSAVWRNDYVQDSPFEELYIAVDGGCVRLNALTDGGKVIHSPGATRFLSNVDGVDTDVLTSVFGDGAYSAIRVRLRSAEPKTARLFYGFVPSLDVYDGSAFCAATERDGVIEAVNCRSGAKLYARCIGARSKCVTDAARLRARLSKEPVRDGAKSDRPLVGFECECGAEACELAIVLSDDEQGLRVLTLGDVDDGIAATEKFYRELSPIKVSGLGKSAEIYFNKWLCPQIVSSRIFGRCGYYQAGGATGFRDMLQDALALISIDRGEARRIFLNACAHQYEEGDVMHWWHEPCTGVRTKISDDKLFLPMFAAAWIAETGDSGILKERAPFLSSPPLDGIAEARYETPHAASSGTVEEHCDRAIANALKTGRHGLLKIGSGDWNDALNAVGDRGEGESVWLTMFAVRVLRDYAAAVGYDKGQSYLREAQRLAKAAENTFKDGKFARACTDDGEWLGRDGGAGELDLICQAWAAIADVADRGVIDKALDSASKLRDKRAGIVKLLDPPFDKSRYVGYISAYPRGVRENGAQYTHAAVWYALALFKAGRDVEAMSVVGDLDPVVSALKYGAMRKGEPYVLCGDVYSAPDRLGECGWSWYTGSAAWYFKLFKECVLGITEKNGLIDIGCPKVADPSKLVVEYTIRGTTYRIRYAEGDGDHIASGGLSYLNCTEFKPKDGKGTIELTRVYRGRTRAASAQERGDRT